MNKQIDVSVIVVTYNSEWSKIQATLTSVLKQKDVALEIIIADDGSKNNNQDQIEGFFKLNNFFDYYINPSAYNRGTVINISDALKFVHGKYTKTIAPGDLLFYERTLRDWIDYMEHQKLCVSFGDAVFYSIDSGKIVFHKTKGCPCNKKIYLKDNPKKVFIDYLLVNDTILGASLLMKTNTITQYIQLIRGRIIYAEDYIIRIMIFNQIKVGFFPYEVIWYEYGTGISTSNNTRWKSILHRDYEMSDEIIRQEGNNRSLQGKKYMLYLKINNSLFRKIVKVLLFPQFLPMRYKMKFINLSSIEKYDNKYIERCFLGDIKVNASH